MSLNQDCCDAVADYLVGCDLAECFRDALELRSTCHPFATAVGTAIGFHCGTPNGDIRNLTLPHAKTPTNAAEGRALTAILAKWRRLALVSCPRVVVALEETQVRTQMTSVRFVSQPCFTADILHLAAVGTCFVVGDSVAADDGKVSTTIHPSTDGAAAAAALAAAVRNWAYSFPRNLRDDIPIDSSGSCDTKAAASNSSAAPNTLVLVNTLDFTKFAALRALGPNALRGVRSLSAPGNTYQMPKINVVLPASLETTGDHALSNASLGLLDLSACVNLRHIGPGFCSGAKLTAIRLPPRLEELGKWAFYSLRPNEDDGSTRYVPPEAGLRVTDANGSSTSRESFELVAVAAGRLEFHLPPSLTRVGNAAFGQATVHALNFSFVVGLDAATAARFPPASVTIASPP